MNPGKPIVAAFDFDGTLTYRDSLIPFLMDAVGPSKTVISLAKQIPLLLRYLFGQASRQEVKEGILTSSVGGMAAAQLELKGKEFAHTQIHKLLKPEAMQKFHWHKSQGHRCILVSANLNVYLFPWGLQEGFQDILCSILQVDKQDSITGLLEGKNCRGPEKSRRLLELLGARDTFILYAYGDSRGDRELLEMADYPFYRKFD